MTLRLPSVSQSTPALRTLPWGMKHAKTAQQLIGEMETGTTLEEEMKALDEAPEKCRQCTSTQLPTHTTDNRAKHFWCG